MHVEMFTGVLNFDLKIAGLCEDVFELEWS